MTMSEVFDSGAIRDIQRGKPRFDLITPGFTLDFAQLLADKAEHYGDRNWEKGIPTDRSFGSLERHVQALKRGEWIDPDSGHPHTVHIAANSMFIHEFHGTEFDTLKVLQGPFVKFNPPPRYQLNKAYEELFPGQKVYQTDPEPPRGHTYVDSEGDQWKYYHNLGGWCVNPNPNHAFSHYSWDELQGISESHEMYAFPWERVSE
jgi:hypothetical protein